MSDLRTLLNLSAQQHHGRLCPRQVLGVRIGMYAGELLGLVLPQQDKRLFAFVEMDGCLIDGITAATGCSCGHRTMCILDFGKTAATFIDTVSQNAVRICPNPSARIRASEFALDAPDRWQAQLMAYQCMPTSELLIAAAVRLQISLEEWISEHGKRVVCQHCGEDIINQREVKLSDKILCRACAGESYYYQPLNKWIRANIPDPVFDSQSS